MKFKEVNIGSLGQVITGNTPLTSDKEFYGGTYQFIKPTDMDIDRRRVTKWEENYTEKAFKKYKNSYIPKGATGVVTIGTVGEKMFQADRDCFTNQSVNVVIPNDEYDQDFIYYLLKFNLPKVSNANPGTASGRHHVSKSNFCAINVIVPSEKSVQTKIGQILSAYDDFIENNLKRIKLLEELAQRTYEEWFVKFRINGKQLEIGENGLPDGWEYGTLGDLINFQSGFAFKAAKFVEVGQPVIKIKNIGNNNVDINNTDCVDEDYAKSAVKFSLTEGDLLIAMTGATVGKVGYVPFSKKTCYLNQRVGRFLNYKGKSNLHFTFSLMTQGDGLQQVLNLAGGAAQPNISGNQILSIKTVIPTEDLLVKYNSFAENNIKQILNLQNQNRLLKESRDILLPRLMSGKIGVGEIEKAQNESLKMVAEPREEYSKG